MAYDKVVDSTQLETALKAMADAIREKTGDTALIEWLANKGFAEEIAGIESGGGGVLTASGTFIPAEDQTSTLIDTGVALSDSYGGPVGEVCLFMLWKNNKQTVNGSYEFLFWRRGSTGYCYSYGYRPGGNVYNSNTSSTMIAEIGGGQEPDSPVVFNVKGNTTANYTYGLVGGIEYGWALVVNEGWYGG